MGPRESKPPTAQLPLTNQWLEASTESSRADPAAWSCLTAGEVAERLGVVTCKPSGVRGRDVRIVVAKWLNRGRSWTGRNEHGKQGRDGLLKQTP